MEQPAIILSDGVKIKTHDTLKHNFPYARRTSATGAIDGVAGGYGGDVYWVRHEDGVSAPYCFDEFELVT